jgi:hypothetical protein
MLLRCFEFPVLIFELEALPGSDIDWSAAVRTSLLLILLFREALSSSDGEVLVRSLSVGIRNVSVGGMFMGKLTR